MNEVNLFQVPKKQWDKWDNRSRHIFNYVYECMSVSQELYLHPKIFEVVVFKDTHWQTTCWNAAWMAAEANKEYSKCHNSKK